ncbi:MAG: cell division ATP-binding protein FtsE [Firmicutes bacterium HGW-Firmicutes-21]|nr:MAG: cell division ATP-binding protein FtsE [Firmicutes bacterium HGW-Firmicutes-21]
MIEFNDVSMVYPNGTVALKNVNLKIEDGEFVFIVGQSGAGKTTLTKLLLREEKISAGKLHVNGFKLEKIRERKIPKLRRTMGFVFQDFRLFDNKTAYENVAFAMRVIGEKPSLIRKRVPFFLNVVNLSDKYDSFPDELSGGEKQRVAFARALVNNPHTIIADEPTGNIDCDMSCEIMELLMRINKLGKTVIVVTHDRDIVSRYKKRVITIKDGVIASDRIGGYDDNEEN